MLADVFENRSTVQIFSFKNNGIHGTKFCVHLFFRRLKESLGECGTPKIGWQIDPFGHSRENAAIMAKMGFDGLFLGRIDYQDKVTRNYNRAFEMLWHTSENDMS